MTTTSTHGAIRALTGTARAIREEIEQNDAQIEQHVEQLAIRRERKEDLARELVQVDESLAAIEEQLTKDQEEADAAAAKKAAAKAAKGAGA